MKKWKVRIEFDAIVYADNEANAMEHEELFNRVNNVRYIVAEEIGDEE